MTIVEVKLTMTEQRQAETDRMSGVSPQSLLRLIAPIIEACRDVLSAPAYILGVDGRRAANGDG
jgi:hypothetical protein